MKRHLLLLLAALLPVVANAYDAEINGIYYYFSGNEATVTSNGSGSYSGSVVIPESVTYNGTTYSVTTIGDNTFSGCSSLTSINIPNSVTTIGSYAFFETPWYNNQPNGLVYAGKVAYKYKGIMPAGTQITLEEGTLGIAASAFYGCSDLTSVNIPNSVITIGDYAFKYCSVLTSIIIPNSVTTIGNEAFYYCSSLTSITIGNSVTTIGSSAFSVCSGLTSITIGNSVTTIGESAFCGCTSLTSITIPNSVTTIGDYTFSGCGSLTSINIPNSVTTIGSYAFYNCSSLTDVTIGNRVTTIGSSAFCNCTILTSITFGNSVTRIGNLAFAETAWYTNQPDGLVYAGKVAYKYKGTMPAGTQITLEEGTLGIADHAFSGCSDLTSVTIPNSVTTIGYYAFQYCSVLTSITIGNSVTSIGGYAFYGCYKLTSITIPNSVTTIGSYSFYGCSSLTSITIPNSVTTIGSYSFYGCSGLTSVTIPNSVTTIGQSAFSGCISLTSITIPNSVTSIGSSAFYGCSGLTSVTIPNSVTTIGQSAFSGCISLTSITIPNIVTSIGNSAFYGCKLRNVLIKCTTPPTGGAAFSEQTYYHTTLYVPTGSWDAYAYDDAWYKFHNIRETATAEEQVSMRQAYTLMDAGTFAYSVYDSVNDEIGTISSVGVDENNPNHSWQVIEADGSRYLYNVGAKKFVVASTNGSFSLSDVPTSITMEDGDNGIIFGTQATKQWALVSNESMIVEQAVIDGISLTPALSKGEGECYSLDGKKLDKPQRSINIIRYSDGSTRKVVVK